MKIFFSVFFSIIAIILLLGMIGDIEAENRRYYTFALIATITAITVIYLAG